MNEKCSKTYDIFSRYLDKTMSIEDKKHLKKCPICMSYIENASAVIETVQKVMPPIPANLRAKIWSAVKKARREELSKLPLKQRLKSIASTLVAEEFPDESVFFDKIWSIFERQPEITRSAPVSPKRLIGAVGLAGGDAGKEARLVRIIILSFLRTGMELSKEARLDAVLKKVITIAKRCGASKELLIFLEERLKVLW